MNNMKAIRLFVLTTAFLLGFTGIVAARAVRIWPYQELLDLNSTPKVLTTVEPVPEEEGACRY